MKMLEPLEMLHAKTFMDRFLGLFKVGMLRENQALIIVPCSSIHTLFMRYSIAVIFLDGEGVVKKVVDKVPPFRFAFCWRAEAAVECMPGSEFVKRSVVGSPFKWN